jgi:molybdenum cofactor cytidylyltransferase
MKQFKPLLPLGEATLADHVISTFMRGEVDVFLVVGYQHDKLRTHIKKRDINIIENLDYGRGMFTSIQAGVRRLPASHQAFFIMPIDIPLVRPSTIKQLLDAAEEHPGNIIFPVFGKKRGHPPLIPSSLIPVILGWKQGGGLKSILNSQEKIAWEVPVADSNILFDVDTPEDYKILLERYQNYELPTDEECEAIYDICQITPGRIRHCIKTAEVAVEIGKALIKADHNLNMEVIRIAAKLHDIAKGQPKHDFAGGQILRELGFGKVADIVGVHTDLSEGNTGIPLEAKVVYLADKFVEGERLVSIEERYRFSHRQFGLTPEIKARILKRQERALSVKRELERLLGYPLEKVIFP